MKLAIAIFSAGVLILAFLLIFHPTADRHSSDPAQSGSSEANEMAAEHDEGSSAEESGADASPGTRGDEQAPRPEAPAPDGVSGGEAFSVERADPVSTPAPANDSPNGQGADVRLPRVAAECWGLRGVPFNYVVTLDREVRTSGTASAVIASRPGRSNDANVYATMFQTSAATPVRGRRVEFSADIRTRGATHGANLLLRAEDANGRTVAFDNMTKSYNAERRPDQLFNRGITGDTEWSTERVIVDIPPEAAVITYGMSLFGTGKAWIDNARIEVVTDDVATTAIDALQSPTPPNGFPVNPASLKRSPRNLDFDLEAQAGASPCN